MTYVDANVVLRVLLNDTSHKRYTDCVRILLSGSVICREVVLEVVANFLFDFRKRLAYAYAVDQGELDVYSRNVRLYTQKLTPPAGWRKQAYRSLSIALNKLLNDYNIVYEDESLILEALDIGCARGFDWTDCVLLAGYKLGRFVPSSVDEHIEKYMCFYSPTLPLPEEEVIPARCAGEQEELPTRSLLSKMDLEHPRDNTEK